jgi:hypothetical protein
MLFSSYDSQIFECFCIKCSNSLQSLLNKQLKTT